MFNFKKISAIGTSILMIGMTAGVAAAANYPAPFVVGGNANVAIVYGTGSGVSILDAVEAGNLQTNLQSFMGSGASGTSTSTNSGVVSLSSGTTKIWLNTSLNTALTTLTKTDLPTILAPYTFSGNVNSKITSTISIGSNKVTFAKQPSTNDDPVIGVTTSTNSSNPLYTASITMPAINFTSTNSVGESINLFGKNYVVSASTDTTDLVLFSSAKEVTLSKTGTENPSVTVTIGGTDHTVKLLNGDSSSATISVDGTTKTISIGDSKKVSGVEVAVKSSISSTVGGITTTLLIGSEKLTFTDNTQVTKGSDNDPIDGTMVTFTGNTGALTGLSVAVYAPSNDNDTILAGQSFVDPVFGSFKVDFSGLSSPLNDSSRGIIKIDKAGDKGMSLTFTDGESNTKTFDFAYNASGKTFLGDSNSYKINDVEGNSLKENAYTIIGNENYGHLIQVTRIYNSSSTDYSKDSVTFRDVMSGDTYSMDATGEGTGRLTVDGRQYGVTYAGNGDTGTVTLKYPTSDSSATQKVIFPTIKTKNGALVSLYEPQTVDLTGLTGLRFPNGDGYTTATISTDGTGKYTLGGVDLNATAGVNLTVGQLKYNFATVSNTTSTNTTVISLYRPGASTLITAPAVVVLEGKDDNSNYEAIVVDVEANAAGTSSNPLGVNDAYFTSSTLYGGLQLQSNSDIAESVDLFGTEVTTDSSTASQKVVTISYPKSQVYANVYVGGENAVVSTPTTTTGGSTQLGDVLVKDTEVNSVSSENLIIVGGSCINSVAATVLGGAYCGSAFTQATGVGTGQFLIKSVASKYATGKIALVVAGYNAADTVNAAKYLRTQLVDTSVGKEYKGTTSTSAELVTTNSAA